MNRIVMGVSYDGSQWSGWQKQIHRNTIQDVLEYSINQFISPKYSNNINTICAGRTDAGVHATMQIVHFDTILDRSMESWVRGVNTFLPDSISVLWARNISSDFHARFSAISRTYTYILYQHKIRPSILNKKVGWLYNKIDMSTIYDLSKIFLGKHDFNNFRSSQCQSKNPVKTIYEFNICEKGNFIIFKIKGNSFLYHMVRNIIGALIQVASNKKNNDWLKELFHKKSKDSICTFSPYGLYLSSITYPDKFNLDISSIDDDFLGMFNL